MHPPPSIYRCDFPQKPRRHLTFLIYLNDLPADSPGGETTFPRMKLAIRPEKNMALVFNDVLDSGMDDERSEHSSTPPSPSPKPLPSLLPHPTLTQIGA